MPFVRFPQIVSSRVQQSLFWQFFITFHCFPNKLYKLVKLFAAHKNEENKKNIKIHLKTDEIASVSSKTLTLKPFISTFFRTILQCQQMAIDVYLVYWYALCHIPLPSIILDKVQFAILLLQPNLFFPTENLYRFSAKSLIIFRVTNALLDSWIWTVSIGPITIFIDSPKNRISTDNIILFPTLNMSVNQHVS